VELAILVFTIFDSPAGDYIYIYGGAATRTLCDVNVNRACD
jgi:hypothetical protein